MKDYLKLAAIVLLFIAGSAVESHAGPYGQVQLPTWSNNPRQQAVNMERYRNLKATQERRYKQQTQQRLNNLEFRQNYPDYYPRYR